MLVVGFSVCGLVVVVIVVTDGGVMEVGVGFAVVLERVGVGLFVMLVIGSVVDVGMLGFCVDTLGAWGFKEDIGMVVEGLDVGLGLCVFCGLSIFVVVIVVVCVFMVCVVRVVVFGVVSLRDV